MYQDYKSAPSLSPPTSLQSESEESTSQVSNSSQGDDSNYESTMAEKMTGGHDDEDIDGLMNTLRCQRCLHFLVRPIRQCRSGHFFCDYCFHNIRKCIICRRQMSSARCFLPEAFTDHITFPCRHAQNGCTFVGKGTDMQEHQDSCAYVFVRCPTGPETSCTWRGPMHAIRAHALASHHARCFKTDHQNFTFKQFVNKDYTGRHKYVMLFDVYDNLFSCTVEINFHIGMVRCGVALVASPDQPNNYCFEIEFLNKKEHALGFQNSSTRGPCVYYQTLTNNWNTLYSTPHNSLYHLCDDTGGLHYSIKIIDTLERR